MRITLFVPVAIALLAAACAVSTTEHENVGSDRQAILGGAATSLYPEVGIIGHMPDGDMCTATLIAPNLVLTSGDCVRPNLDSGPAYAFYTGIGATFTGNLVTEAVLDKLANTTKHDVLESVVYPGAVYTTSPYQNDVAYVRLATPIFDITPAKLGAAPAANAVCTIVGFGIMSTTMNTGLYRQAGTVTVQSITDTINVTGGSAQFRGDGGGPLYCNGLQVGVFSWTDDFSSATSTRRQARVDGDVGTWIESVMSMYPVTADAGTDASVDAGGDASSNDPPKGTYTTPPGSASSSSGASASADTPTNDDDTTPTTSHCSTTSGVGHPSSTSEWLLTLVVALVVVAARRRAQNA